jgi:FtsP/CotA-like multicopper oxidase with cupredoxin domain
VRTFVYEFEALEPAVGIYHSHNGASQVLDGLFGAITIGEMQTPDVLLETRDGLQGRHPTRRSRWCSTMPASSV